MAINLTIDQGNSAAKLALWDGNRLVALRVEERLTKRGIERFLSPHGPVESTIYCSVSGNDEVVLQSIADLSSRIIKLRSDMPLPIALDYKTPATLGADRIAAAVGAWSLWQGSPILVVDAGTAVTYDVVTADSHFLGGNIAPGMHMRLKALHEFTARLPRVRVPREINYDTFLGYDTESAMILGAVYGIVGAISYYKSRLPHDTQVVMTGGWARELSSLCDFPINVEPNLVSIGLNRILLYNNEEI